MTVEGVMRTGGEAAASKWSAASKSYFDYAELEYFVQERRPRQPLINRGYFTRVQALRSALLRFAKETTSDAAAVLQVVNLGCGQDPLYFWLQSTAAPGLSRTLRYFEVDFPQVLTHKADIIAKVPDLAARAGMKTQSEGERGLLQTQSYRMVPADLRFPLSLLDKLIAAGLDQNQPVCFLLECVLTYLPAEPADALIAAISHSASQVMIVNYDIFNVHDRFGAMMQQNLASRSCDIDSTARFADLDALRAHYKNLLPHNAALRLVDMNHFWNVCIPCIDKFRVEQLELFDELEEWRLIQTHYFLGIASTLHYDATPADPDAQSNSLLSDPPHAARPRFRTEDLRAFPHDQVLAKAAELIYDTAGADQEEASLASRNLLRHAGLQRWLHTPCVGTRFYSAPVLALDQHAPFPLDRGSSGSLRTTPKGATTASFSPLLQSVEETEHANTTLGAFLETR